MTSIRAYDTIESFIPSLLFVFGIYRNPLHISINSIGSRSAFKKEKATYDSILKHIFDKSELES